MEDQSVPEETPSLPDDELFAMAVRDAPLGIGIASSDLHLTYANDRWRELSGFDGPLPAEPGVMLDLVHPDDRDRVAEAFIAAHVSSGQVRERIRAVGGDDGDAVRHLSLTLRPIRDDPANGYVLGLSDITELMAALTDARRSEERFRTVASSLPIGVYRADTRGNLIWTNRRLVELGRYQGAQERGSSIYHFIHPDDVDEVAKKATEAFRQKAHFEAQHRFLASDGSVRWVISRASPILDEHGRIIEHIGSMEDVTELHLKNLGLAHRAAHDPLTDLPNRAAIIELVSQLAEQTPGRNDVGVVFLDLDGFKAVNDQYGHQAGDAVLVEVSDRLRRVIRQFDTVGRYGGDEFVIVCPGITDPEVLEGVALRATEIIASNPVNDGIRDHQVGASVGTGLGPGAGSVDDLLRRADEAMYEAKRRKQ
jgi:diguanylate cyclase (GGDEF)-like protein/PAS domain S-box-containing protein